MYPVGQRKHTVVIILLTTSQQGSIILCLTGLNNVPTGRPVNSAAKLLWFNVVLLSWRNSDVEVSLSSQLQRGRPVLVRWVCREPWRPRRAPRAPPRARRPPRRPRAARRAGWRAASCPPPQRRRPTCPCSRARAAPTSAMRAGRSCSVQTTSKYQCPEDLYIIMMLIYNLISALERSVPNYNIKA